MRGFERNLSGHASGSQIGLRIEQYEYCDHSPLDLFVHAILDVEPLELNPLRQRLQILPNLRIIRMLPQLRIRLFYQILPRHARNDKFEILEQVRDQRPVLAIINIGVGRHLLGVKPVIEAFVGLKFLEFFHGDHWDRVNFHPK